jgi:hypothetical protein
MHYCPVLAKGTDRYSQAMFGQLVRRVPSLPVALSQTVPNPVQSFADKRDRLYVSDGHCPRRCCSNQAELIDFHKSAEQKYKVGSDNNFKSRLMIHLQLCRFLEI